MRNHGDEKEKERKESNVGGGSREKSQQKFRNNRKN